MVRRALFAVSHHIVAIDAFYILTRRLSNGISGPLTGGFIYYPDNPSPAAKRRPRKKSSRSSGLRQYIARGTTTGVMVRSRPTISRASSSRPICAQQDARKRGGGTPPD